MSNLNIYLMQFLDYGNKPHKSPSDFGFLDSQMLAHLDGLDF